MADRIRPPAGKQSRLLRWGEPDTDDFLSLLNEDEDSLGPLADDFNTLKISPAAAANFSSPAADSRARPTISPGMFMRFQEPESASMGDDFDLDHDLDPETLKGNLFKHARALSGAPSLVSPVRRRSLSNYSESTDTDITEMNDEDFEGIDDIFGKEESGIYSSGGVTRSSANLAAPCRAKEALSRRKQQLADAAEAEDEEMYARFKSQHGDEVNTLKLKDLRSYGLDSSTPDILDNENTINYEYTKDDFESFEDGFVGDLPSEIKPSKLKQFLRLGLPRKASMPVFPKSLKVSRPTKFKSSMDLAKALGEEHPVFNNNNKLIRKLDRMPSFHQKDSGATFTRDDVLNYNMEMHKKQLLEKYMEITEKQFQLKTSPRKKKSSRPTKKGVGLVRYLNDQTLAPITGQNSKMKFNPEAKRWEGNAHDLMRFEENAPPKKPPGLITLEQFRKSNNNVKSNMVYDAENLRWVNTDSLDEDKDVFNDLPDLVPNDIPKYTTLRSPSKPILPERGVSAFTQRTVLTVSTGSLVSNTSGHEFVISKKNLARFEKEEAKIRKKTQNWFGANETYHLKRPRTFSHEYFWEIRHMVVDDGR